MSACTVLECVSNDRQIQDTDTSEYRPDNNTMCKGVVNKRSLRSKRMQMRMFVVICKAE